MPTSLSPMERTPRLKGASPPSSSPVALFVTKSRSAWQTAMPSPWSSPVSVTSATKCFLKQRRKSERPARHPAALASRFSFSALFSFKRDFVSEEAHPEHAHSQTAEQREKANRATIHVCFEGVEDNQRKPGDCRNTGPAQLGYFHVGCVELMIEENNH